MKASVIKEMTREEISEKLVEETDLISKMKMNHAVSTLENPMILKEKRKVIARLKTELAKRPLNANN